MTSRLYAGLSNDLAALLENSQNYDVIVKVGGDLEDGETEFNVHSLLLTARSPYFRAALSKDWAKNYDEKGLIILTKPNVSASVFQIILNYVYTGVIEFDRQEVFDLLDLLVAADELILGELVEHTQDYLIQHNAKWLQKNIVKVLHTIFRHDTCDRLQNYYSDVQSWTRDHFSALENTLHQCIPLIRFFHISSDDYFKKVLPYKRILPKSLKHDIYGYFLSQGYQPKSLILPPRILPIESVIINNKHASFIESWIQAKGDDDGESQCAYNSRLDTHSKRLEFNWRLLYRASRDGFSAADFHARCDNCGACVVVIKVRGHSQVIGGYNPLGWYYYLTGYISTSDSFVFSMDASRDPENFELNRVKDPDNAIYQDRNRGPTFGYPDLSVSDRCNENSRSNYEPKSYYIQNRTTPIPSFYVDDYEVFQVHH
ncbi:13586_t:CDS:2 [Acaulospora morrowiae]|uniref:13586_t:CDS:1 n=1 Tax=Acaulospora morrowiae TaxID=94023 RepID=A0A9N8YPQ8_9GLOM|nr:13586_t:CDS:2 [Acaulospora morrowiae]